MKYNFKNFPQGINKSDLEYIADMVIWKRNCEAELREIEKKWQKYYGMYTAYIPIKELLGE